MSAAKHTPEFGPVYDSTGRLMAAVGPLVSSAKHPSGPWHAVYSLPWNAFVIRRMVGTGHEDMRADDESRRVLRYDTKRQANKIADAVNARAIIAKATGSAS